MIAICITLIICVIVICAAFCYVTHIKVLNNPVLFEGDDEVNEAKIRTAYGMTTLFKERYILPSYNNEKEFAFQGTSRDIRTFLDNLINVLK